MNCINRVGTYIMGMLPTRSYSYFDAHKQLVNRELNIFQCFARKAFGSYADTHLENVVDKGYQLTLNGQFQGTPEQTQKFLQLIAKVNKAYGAHHGSVLNDSLPEFKLSWGGKCKSEDRLSSQPA